jgi:hypothetical protein
MFAPFLSAYDPSDLPGGSIDPLGFERGYLFLADKILPGLTNAAGRPRYFSVVCAGAFLAPPAIGNERENIRVRAGCVLRIERFWAAANVLASERAHNLPTYPLGQRFRSGRAAAYPIAPRRRRRIEPARRGGRPRAREETHMKRLTRRSRMAVKLDNSMSRPRTSFWSYSVPSSRRDSRGR